jgi:Tol biopolymer transport system component
MDIFVYDLDRNVAQRLTGDEGDDHWPIFSPDGRRVVYNSNRGGRKFVSLDTRAADGSGQPDSLSWGQGHQQPQTWGASGSELIYSVGPSALNMDLWVLPMTGSRIPHPLFRTQRLEAHPAMSADGRWLAWVSDASGRPEVMVRRYPDGADTQVSREGAWEPMWGPGGREILFRDMSGAHVFAAPFLGGDPARVEPPKLLFTGAFTAGSTWGRSVDVSPDGRRFVVPKRPADLVGVPGYAPLGTEIRVVPGFADDVRRRLRSATR